MVWPLYNQFVSGMILRAESANCFIEPGNKGVGQNGFGLICLWLFAFRNR